MFDYKLLAALAAVVEQGGFERAAHVLGLSQSAVSQRIKLLEARIGQPVIVRTSPPTSTDVGQRLLNHVQQVRLLERDLHSQVPGLDEARTVERLRVAINADSLATWWAASVGPFCTRQGILLDLVVEDQEVGLKRMQAGEVAACVCASARPVAGARAVLLGAMRYRAVASPAFHAHYLSEGVTAERLAQVPAVVYGPDDQLQHHFLARLGFTGHFDHHLCPSSEGFVKMVANGLGWGLLPELQTQAERERGELIDLVPGQVIDVPLYWHSWRNGGDLLTALTRHLESQAACWLVAT
ncbi:MULTISPECIES: LysR family transcriptional regulator ArgP [unclassified Pseudomonas]|uniref:LysR family transcriptional regulator ArgP n=1 Tax=unclassified Pseudomonas TaxID=196821 RepID=UPI000EFD19DA|nr:MULTISPECIES: LysR family transcriptional regulator ArgP [unclassified Pseudomonas]AYN93815.1 LysR family transcriptional regulator ArgP [Pseudomonas sp. LTJR-52]MDN3234599.1 LysR family transcriptional regulator ArgP [Pseudomonas sp. WAC2]